MGVMVHMGAGWLVGKKFTWFGAQNRRCKLDRFLVDAQWMSELQDPVQEGLIRPFKFINGWLEKQGCREVIKEFLEVSGDKSSNLPVKLRKLKAALKNWNAKSCVNFDSKVKELENRINELEERSNSVDFNSELLNELKDCRLELWENIRLQEALWKQKSRLNWAAKGDLNTEFFHKAVKVRAKRRSIHELYIGGKRVDDPKSLREAFYSYVRFLYCGERDG
ncbi:hypothetical protein V6N13_085473 [Hibiscus sabdariffa]